MAPPLFPLLFLNMVLTARAAIRQAFTLSLESLDVVKEGKEEEGGDTKEQKSFSVLPDAPALLSRPECEHVKDLFYITLDVYASAYVLVCTLPLKSVCLCALVRTCEWVCVLSSGCLSNLGTGETTA